MMKIDMTSEEFANKVKKMYETRPDTDRSDLIKSACVDTFVSYLGVEPDNDFNGLSFLNDTEIKCLATTSINTITAKLDRQEAEYHRKVFRYKHTGQMPMFDSPGFRTPEWMNINSKKKHQRDATIAEVCRWFAAEDEHYDEKEALCMVALSEVRDHHMVLKQERELAEKTKASVIAAGRNPEEVTIAEATEITQKA